jgi:membrane protease YdiL (CAAX protease family)
VLSKLLQRATIGTWQAIDDEYRTDALPDLRAAAVLVTAAVGLLLARFFGQEQMVEKYSLLGALYGGLPYPSLRPHAHWGLFKLVNYGLLPWLCIKFVLRRPLSDFGVRWHGTRNAGLTYAAMLTVVLPFVVAASSSASFLRTYPKYHDAGDSLGQLLGWELVYCLQFLMLEFFFRGFLIFALARYIGSLAVFVMVVPYVMIHFGKPFAECLGSVLAGIALGTIALRTRSIWGGVLVHCVVGVSMDLLALARTGKLQALL